MMFSRKRWIYGGLLLVLFGLYAVRYGHLLQRTDGSTGDQIAALQGEIKTLEAQRQEVTQTEAEMAAVATRYWVVESLPPVNQVQAKIQQLATRHGVSFDRVSEPKILKLEGDLEAVEVSFSAVSDMSQISAFLYAVEMHRPVLEWANFSVRPDRPKDPTSVICSGRIRALYLTQSQLHADTSAPAPAAIVSPLSPGR